jgi:hypothetical protein
VRQAGIPKPVQLEIQIGSVEGAADLSANIKTAPSARSWLFDGHDYSFLVVGAYRFRSRTYNSYPKAQNKE